MTPAKDRKSVESTTLSDPLAMASASGVCDGVLPAAVRTSQGASKCSSSSAVALVADVTFKCRDPAMDESSAYCAVSSAPSCISVSEPPSFPLDTH